MRFEIKETKLSGLAVIERHIIGDERGYLERMFCTTELSELLGDKRVVQINHSFTARAGTVRGMHYQKPPHAEIKLVSCLRGEIYDVAVDLRRGSPTFLQWHGEILSGSNHKSLCIPEGFAHGFQTLTDDCDLLYMHTAAWNQSAEAGVNVRDSAVGILWPKPIRDLSRRDIEHPMLTPDFAGVGA